MDLVLCSQDKKDDPVITQKICESRETIKEIKPKLYFGKKLPPNENELGLNCKIKA